MDEMVTRTMFVVTLKTLFSTSLVLEVTANVQGNRD